MESDPAFNSPRIRPSSIRSRSCEDDPTPEEIAAACEEIQSSWSDAERILRASGANRHLTELDERRRSS